MRTSANVCVLAVAGLLIGVPASPRQAAKSPANPKGWQAAGTLFEACSCSVPCPCNFGQGPSNSYCHTIYAYRLKTATYDGVKLDGLVFGGGEGEKGSVGFLDARVTAAQKPILEKLALAVFGKGGASSGPRAFTTVKIVVEDDARTFRLDFAGVGGFTADILMGRDRKNPIIVENNTTWPVTRFIKGKTSAFDYKDSLGNDLKYDGVNANLGEFKLEGDLRPAAQSASASTAGCCPACRTKTTPQPTKAPQANRAR
ncbi:MAG TPA: DUF1326 domain-containing protein [Chthonomonadaceae bacterium]|nr:DUF1326 domain-containing protein [Chthonomonadaceae bacterium]